MEGHDSLPKLLAAALEGTDAVGNGHGHQCLKHPFSPSPERRQMNFSVVRANAPLRRAALPSSEGESPNLKSPRNTGGYTASYSRQTIGAQLCVDSMMCIHRLAPLVRKMGERGQTPTQPPHAPLHYIDDFLGLDCASRLLDLKLFPNSKEITESMACWRYVCVHKLDFFVAASPRGLPCTCPHAGKKNHPQRLPEAHARPHW